MVLQISKTIDINEEHNFGEFYFFFFVSSFVSNFKLNYRVVEDDAGFLKIRTEESVCVYKCERCRQRRKSEEKKTKKIHIITNNEFG